jgi:beta-lactamase superfamily II metal-dependent hydrolase
MSKIKSFSVGNGDMFYIKHGNDNFTIIDCCLSEDNKAEIVSNIKNAKKGKTITRFISTHPDEDHLRGLKYLDNEIDILNFYCVKNMATKNDESDDFKHYRTLRSSSKAFHVSKDCTRKWMNESCEERGSSGVHILWPKADSEHHVEHLGICAEGGSPNNISTIIQYNVGKATFLWMGDLETDFLEKIKDSVVWPETTILFAPHHGRDSGKVPQSILDKLKPKIVVIGEAPSQHLNYYQNHNTLTQNTAGTITFDTVGDKVHIFNSEVEYSVDFLDDEYTDGDDYYLGTFNL